MSIEIEREKLERMLMLLAVATFHTPALQAERTELVEAGLKALAAPVQPVQFEIGGRYNWKGQQERLIYMGYNFSGNGYWHQFAKVEAPGKVWCEVQPEDLSSFEATPPAAQRQWVDLTPQELTKVFANSITGEGAVHLALAKSKELNT